MMKISTWPVKFIILLDLLLCSFPADSVGTTYQNILAEDLRSGPASSLKLNGHGRNSDEIDAALLQIYQDNQFHLFWIKDGRPSQRGADIFAVLQDADQHGLVPSDYLISNIKHFWKRTDPAGLVKLDIVLTLGMMRYVADQREGRLQPRQLDPELFATASAVEVDWQALFQTAFRASDMKAFLEQQAPPFLHYILLKKKLAEYRLIAAGGGWPSIPGGETLRPGMADPRLATLQKRLAVSGDLTALNAQSAVYDQRLAEGVKKFQKRHNLTPDGIVGAQTLAAINVPVEFRIRQIIVNMERYRWLERRDVTKLVAVNIAGFAAAAGKPDKFELTMPVIVGKPYHKTPVFNDMIEYVVFNPYWSVPPSIARNEILPMQKKDPTYLQKHKMRIFRGWKPGAVELAPSSINWHTLSAKQMDQYHIRQDPGPDNALGTLKIIFPNAYNVYLHDTPAHALFSHNERALSHGCIRLSRPAKMAAWVLGGETNGWSTERVKEIIATGKQQVVTLDQPLAVYVLYRTAYVRPADDTLMFYSDIYGRDKLLMQALFNKTD